MVASTASIIDMMIIGVACVVVLALHIARAAGFQIDLSVRDGERVDIEHVTESRRDMSQDGIDAHTRDCIRLILIGVYRNCTGDECLRKST